MATQPAWGQASLSAHCAADANASHVQKRLHTTGRDRPRAALPAVLLGDLVDRTLGYRMFGAVIVAVPEHELELFR